MLAVLLLGGVGYALGLLTDSGPVGLKDAPIVAVAMSLGSYFYGDRIVLASTRAKEVSKEDALRLHNLVEGLAIAAGTRRRRSGSSRRALPTPSRPGEIPSTATSPSRRDSRTR